MASTPKPPYVAVIFTNQRTVGDDDAYGRAAARMVELASEIPGFLAVETVRGNDGVGITISYWTDEVAVADWRSHPEHLDTQAQGRTDWYEWYELRVGTVERARSYHRDG